MRNARSAVLATNLLLAGCSSVFVHADASDMARDAHVDAARDTSDAAPMDVALDQGRDAVADAIPATCDGTSSRLTWCSDHCVDTQSDPSHCGACGHDCTRLPFVTSSAGIACVAGRCTVPASACAENHAHCSSDPDDGCETDTHSDAHCGNCSTSCAPSQECGPVASGGSACRNRCNAPWIRCGSGCADPVNDRNHCGSCDVDCVAAPFTNSMCFQSHCTAATCFDGYHFCQGLCVDSGSVDHCGTACSPCIAPSHATATCDGARCNFACDRFFTRSGDSCVPSSAPRPIAPLSTSRATSTRPTFRWQLASGTDAARIEWCRDRACSDPIGAADAPGTQFRPTTALPSGPVFWRLRAVTGGVISSESSATWEVFVPTTDHAIDTSRGSRFDSNGDGIIDALIGSMGAAFEFAGGPDPASAPPRVLSYFADGHADFGISVSSAGDVDGDGYADVVVGADGTFWAADVTDPSAASRPAFPPGHAVIFRGGSSGLSSTPSQVFASQGRVADGFGSVVGSAGDLNGDGYGDVLVLQSRPPRAWVFNGSPAGLVRDDVGSLDGAGSIRGTFGAGDLNGDGFDDVAISNGAVVNVYLGGDSGPRRSAQLAPPPGAGEDFFAREISIGDLDGDGYDDVALFANHFASVALPDGSVAFVDAGRVYVFRGSPSGPHEPYDAMLEEPNTVYYGAGLSAGGDLDGDGVDDLVVGAWGLAPRTDNRVFVYRWNGAGFSQSATLVSPWGYRGSFGETLSVVGDTNGDRIDDLVVGAWGAPYSGAALLLDGAAFRTGSRTARLLQFPTDGTLRPSAIASSVGR